MKQLFDDEEAELLRTAARQDPSIAGKAMEREDGEGGKSKITLWNDEDDGLSACIRGASGWRLRRTRFLAMKRITGIRR